MPFSSFVATNFLAQKITLLSQSVHTSPIISIGMVTNMHCLTLLFVLILLSQTCWSWSWPFSSNEETRSGEKYYGDGGVSDFSIESFNDRRGIELTNRAKSKMLVPNSCWQAAYQHVFEGCSETLADDELRSRLAYHLSDCFRRHTGRRPFPHCDAKSVMKKCLEKLDGDEHNVYLQYYLETNSICHHLQTNAFKQQTERLVNELKTSAEYAEVKLGEIEEQGERLLYNTKQVHNSLSSLNQRTQEVAKSTENVKDHVSSVLKYSENIYEQSKGISASQVELIQGQAMMKENLAQGMELVQESYKNLGTEIVSLQNEAVEIERQIENVGNAMSNKMEVLQSKADDIEDLAGTSLDKQKELLDHQTEALEGLRFLSKFISKALEESGENLQKLTELANKQQVDLLENQKQLYKSHDHLMENSKMILATQEAFEKKQESMFDAIEKLFTLHSAMLFDTRVIINLFLYSVAIFIVYMLTSIKHAYSVRHKIYSGLIATFFIEMTVWWYVTDPEWQGRLIHMARSIFGLLASGQYLYALCTYRDYEVLNHKILLALMEKVKYMEGNNCKTLSWDADSDCDSEVNWSSWVDTELPEDINLLEDPDYVYPDGGMKLLEDEGDSSSSSSKKYNLRRRY